MGKRYTKFKSNYLMRSDHQRTDLGRIMERDWVTTNGLNVLRFGSGRRIWYNSGSFVFTTSNVPTYHKKHRLTTETKEWTWDDVKDADGTVNEVKPSYTTNDLRDYAYYGSCVELIRATIEEIVSDFPGRLVLSNDRLSDYCSSEDSANEDSNDEESNTYQLRNQFNIDLHHDNVILGDYDNEMRFMSQSWANYRVMESEDEETKYVIIGNFSEDFTIGQYVDATTYGLLSDENKEKCKEMDADTWYVANEDFRQDFSEDEEVSRYFRDHISSDNKDYCKGLNWVKTYSITDGDDISDCASENECKVIKTITITTYAGKEYSIDAYYITGNVLYFYEPTDDEGKIYIQPTQECIDDYFASLTGFKAQLLRRDSSPLYTNKFITPTEYNFRWYYPEKQYTWPSDGYCIQVDTMPFSRFVEKMYDMGQSFDEMWTDNLYRSMTHEAIKNFDWSYSREFYPGDAEDNIDGGERMQKIIRVMGRVFDDIKLYIDNIKNVRNVTYDQINNCHEALLSDENSINGIDVVSTIDSDYDINTSISSEFLSSTHITKDNWWKQDTDEDDTVISSSLPRWYYNRHSEDIYPDVCDNEIMRRLAISVKRIMQTKGTQHGIEMMLALFGLGKDVDYTIEEEAYYTEKPILYDECVDGTMEVEEDSNGGSEENDNEKNWDDGTINWKNINNHTKGGLASEINSDKDSELLYYEDSISGVPMRNVKLGRDNVEYLVPYYDSSQLYDGDLVFQGKGGWGRMIKRDDNDSNDDIFDYQETLSYLHVAGTIDSMLSINPVSVDANTIYYVVNLDDYTDYDENPPMLIEKDDDGNVKNDESMTMSHFFILINPSEANKFYAWKNIVVKPGLDPDGNLQPIENIEIFEKFFGSKEDDTRDWAFSPEELSDSDNLDNEKVVGTYKYAFAKMRYLDSIISTNLANNPHVGYGKYDEGETFIEYMKLPFKYTIDNGYFGNSDLRTLAEKYAFNDIGDDVVNDKIQIMNSREVDENGDNGVTDYIWYGTEEDYQENLTGYKLAREYGLKLSDSSTPAREDGYETAEVNVDYNSINAYSPAEINVFNNTKINAYYVRKEDKYNVQKRWYINTKVLTITNIMEENNTLFDNYFKNVIMPYLMQVVPSTTILKLKDFSE